MAEKHRHRKMRPEDLYRFVTVGDPQISPDGEVVAFVRTHVDPKSKEPRSAIWLVPASGGSPIPFTRSEKTDASPRWSPDGRTLAFVSDRSGTPQIWLIDRYGGEARQLTAMRHGASHPVWSPDGRRIAFLSPVGPEDRRELLTRPRTEDEKKVEERKAADEARVFTRMIWRSDAAGILPERRNQIWVVDVPEPGAPMPAPIQVTWGFYDHEDPQWSPDGRLLSFVAWRSEDEHAYKQDVFITPVPGPDHPAARATPAPLPPGEEPPSGEAARELADRLAAAAREAEAAFAPRCLTGSQGMFVASAFSPDGNTLAVLGHLNEYMTVTQFRIWLFPVEGGEPKVLDNWDLSIGRTVNADVRPGGRMVELTWAPDGSVIYVPVTERGACSVYGFPVDGGRPQLVAGGPREIYGYSFDRSGERMAFTAGNMHTIGDVWVMDCRTLTETRLTDVNGALFAELALPEVEELHFKARDGWDLHGWVMKPVDFEPGKQYPLVLEIHGGPATCYGHAFLQEFHLLAAAGYGVLFINPRGSTGYGQQFVDAVRGDYGGRDYNDLMDAVDYALTFGWVDPKRLAVTGGSYGGFMTNWIVTQTDRFAAAITHRSISNWVSFSGTPDFGPFFNIWQHKVADPWSPEGVAALWKISPLAYVQNVRTPISIMHSEFDYRCPIEQAEQFYMAIKYYGKAPVEFVRHPRSNHDLTRQGPPAVRVDRFHRILRWFGRYCPPNEPSGDAQAQ